MHAKPDLRVFLKWMIAGSGSVITDVIQAGALGSWSANARFTFGAISPSLFHRSRDAMLVAACIFALLLLAYQMFSDWEKANRWSPRDRNPFRFFDDDDVVDDGGETDDAA